MLEQFGTSYVLLGVSATVVCTGAIEMDTLFVTRQPNPHLFTVPMFSASWKAGIVTLTAH